MHALQRSDMFGKFTLKSYQSEVKYSSALQMYHFWLTYRMPTTISLNMPCLSQLFQKHTSITTTLVQTNLLPSFNVLLVNATFSIPLYFYQWQIHWHITFSCNIDWFQYEKNSYDLRNIDDFCFAYLFYLTEY